MSLLEKPYRELSEADRDSLFKPVGTSGIPYPGVRAEIKGDNDLDMGIGMIADDESPIPVISTRPHEQVVALAYSNMAAPCALLAERELFEQMRPEAGNLFTLVLGIPGWGKTQLAENVAQMMDNRGFIFLNCADRNLEEILWEQARASVQKVDTNTGAVPKFNPSAVGRKGSLLKAKNPMVAQADFGKHLQEEVENWIGTLTSGMPETRKAIVKEFRERGVAFTLPDQKNTVAQLLNQDMFAGIGGIKSIMALRDVLAKRMRLVNPALRGTTDNELIPMDEAAALCEQLSRLPTNDNTNPNVGRIVTLGNDTKHAFNQASAVDGIATAKHKPVKPKASQLIKTTDFLETLKIPTLANINMRSIWRRTLSNDNRLPSGYAPLAQIAEGTHKSKIGITTIMTQGQNGEAVPVHVMIDGERKKSLIVADAVDADTKAALGADYTVVTYAEAGAEEQVASFSVSEGR